VSNKNDGGPAFPLAATEDTIDFHGMTLRDYMAANADVSGIQMPSPEDAAQWAGIEYVPGCGYFEQLEFLFKLEAFIRYMKADAMLAARAIGGAS